MKTIILLLVCTLVALVSADGAEDDRKLFFKYTKECNDDPSTHADKATLIKTVRREKVEYTPELGAHFLCVTKKMGAIKDDGELDEAVVRALLSRALTDSSVIEDSLSRCLVKKDTAEKTAFYLTGCLRKVLPAPPPPTNLTQ